MATEAFGDIIKAARDRRSWTQEDLAQRVGVTRTVISRYESSETFPPIPDTFNKVVLALGLSPVRLLEAAGVNLVVPRADRLSRELVEAILELPVENQDALLLLLRGPGARANNPQAGRAR